MFVVMTADDRRLTTIFFGSSHATVQGAASAIATAYDRAVRMQDGWDRYGFHGCKIMAWSYADEVAWYRSGKKKGGVA